MSWLNDQEKRCWVDHEHREALSYAALAEFRVGHPLNLERDPYLVRLLKRWYERLFPEGPPALSEEGLAQAERYFQEAEIVSPQEER